MSDRRGRSKGIAVEVVDEPTSRGRSAETAYRRLVRSSSNTFRSSIEFREKPRQIIFGGLLLVAIATMAYFNSSNSAEPMMSSKGAVTAFMLSVITYCSLQSKDGLMLRPHPMLWRAIHGLALFYFCTLIVLIVLPSRIGITAVHDFFPEMSGGSTSVLTRSEDVSVITFDHLDCNINFKTLWRQLSSIWFAAHIVGWWAKMCILRDWQMVLTYSVAFEIVELSLVWLIPEFQECWWDSIFMDALGANLIGMYLGKLTLDRLTCRFFVWEPSNSNAPFFTHMKMLVSRFGPFSWSEYFWPRDNISSWMSSATWVWSLVLEINSFFIMHALLLRPSHWLNPVRQLLLAAHAVQSVPEWYEYVRGKTKRIGHNCWLMIMITILECMLGYRYGKGGRSYGLTYPPWDIQWIFLSYGTLWSIWYAISVYRAHKGEHRARTWLVALRVVAHVPLVFLARRWAY